MFLFRFRQKYRPQATQAMFEKGNFLKPWYTYPWLWLLLAGQIVFILAAVSTTWLAFLRQDSLVVDNYYEHGKAINRDLQRDRLAAYFGLQVNMRYDDMAGTLSGTIYNLGLGDMSEPFLRLIPEIVPDSDDSAADGKLNLTPYSPEPTQTGRLFIKFIHPTQSAKDIKLVAQMNSAGTFSVALPRLDSTRWVVSLEDEHRDWRLNGTWQWPQEKEINIKADKL